MLKLFRRNNHKKENVDNNLYNIVEIEDLSSSLESGFENLDTGQVGAYVIRNAFDKELIEKFKQFYKSEVEPTYTEDLGFQCYPKSFFESMYNGDIDDNIFESTKDCLEKLNVFIGIDFNQKIGQLLRIVDSSVMLKAKSFGEGKELTTIQFRSIKSNTTALPILSIHCEDAHLSETAHFNEQLGEQKLRNNIISWYTPLFKPTNGEGKLVLFDVKWKPGNSLKFIDNQYQIVESSGSTNSCNETGIKRMKIDLDEGDMIIFNGGSIYHAIESFKGENERVSMGSFLNRKRKGEYEYWC